MSSPSSSSSTGVGFTGLLTLLFIGLKLTSVIDWPWVWVLAPLWVGALLVLVLIVIVIGGAILHAIVTRD